MSSSNGVDGAKASEAPLEQTSRLSNEHLKPLIAALQTANAEDEAPDSMEITQKMDPGFVRSLRENTAAPDSESKTGA